MANDKSVKKPTPPTAAEIKSMTEAVVVSKISEFSSFLVEVKNIVVYEIIVNIIVTFVEEVKKVHTDFKVEIPEFPSYTSVSDEMVAAHEIIASVTKIKTKEEVLTQIEVIKKSIYSATSIIVYEIYVKIIAEYITAVNKAHADYKIEAVKIVDYHVIEEAAQKVEEELKESKAVDVTSEAVVKKMDEKTINTTIIDIKKLVYAHSTVEIAFYIYSKRLEVFVELIQETHPSMKITDEVYTSIISFTEVEESTKKLTPVEYKVADIKVVKDCTTVIE